MGKPLGDDMRRRLLLAYDQGEGTLEELASRFGERWLGEEDFGGATVPVRPNVWLTSPGVNRTPALRRNSR